jgi:Peptidase M50B-like
MNWVERRLHLRMDSAIHEAGHAIVALALGYHVEKICVNEDGSGFVNRSHHKHICPDVMAKKNLVVCVAGMVAEGIHHDVFAHYRRVFSKFARENNLCKLEKFLHGNDTNNVREITAIIAKCTGEDFAEIIEAAEKSAEKILRSRWSGVQELATFACCLGYLTELQIPELLGRHAKPLRRFAEPKVRSPAKAIA